MAMKAASGTPPWGVVTGRVPREDPTSPARPLGPLTSEEERVPPDDTGAELETEREVGGLPKDTVTLTPEGDEITTFWEERWTGGTVVVRPE